jgi:hypothetical protein
VKAAGELLSPVPGELMELKKQVQKIQDLSSNLGMKRVG